MVVGAISFLRLLCRGYRSDGDDMSATVIGLAVGVGGLEVDRCAVGRATGTGRAVVRSSAVMARGWYVMARFRSGVGRLWRSEGKAVGGCGEALAQCRQPRREVGVEFGQFDGGCANGAGVQGAAGGVDVQLAHGVIGDA